MMGEVGECNMSDRKVVAEKNLLKGELIHRFLSPPLPLHEQLDTAHALL